MEDKKPSTNVIQFPSRKKEAQPSQPAVESPSPASAPAPRPASEQKRPGRKVMMGGVLAVLLATIAVNRYVYSNSAVDMASVASPSRSIASIETITTRDAAWEKDLAEKLASAPLREVASLQVGREPTMEEKLRWGTLEEKYTITFRREVHEIDSITFQNSEGSNPSYLLDRDQFLHEYAPLFNAESAKLKSIEKSSDKTVEAYTLFDKSAHAKGEARIELDRHKRLLSLKVEPSQI